jgi:hypothetical protein
VDEGARGTVENVEGRRSTHRALDAGILDHVGPVFSVGRSDPRRQDVTINVRRYAIHRCVWVRPPTHVSAVAAPVPRRAAALVALSRGHRWTVSNPEHGHTNEPTTGGGLWPAPAPQLVQREDGGSRWVLQAWDSSSRVRKDVIRTSSAEPISAELVGSPSTHGRRTALMARPWAMTRVSPTCCRTPRP